MKEKSKKGIPRFNNLEEEAKYWEKHSIAPYWDNLEDVHFNIESSKFNNLLLIQLDNKSLQKLNLIARKKRKSIQNLAKGWIDSIAASL
jgi:hypothetical protein